MTKLTEKKLITAIKNTGGIVSVIAKKLDVTWHGARKAIDANPVALQAWHDEREGILDLAESALVKSIQQGDTQDAKWLLSRLGKHRGYAERIEFEDIKDRAAFIQALVTLRDTGKLTPEISVKEFGLDVTEELWPGTSQNIVIINEPSRITV